MAESPDLAVLLDLESATDRHPTDRKLLVSGSMGEGRELLRTLALRRSWIGWEVTTLRRLAMELAAPSLAESALTVADAYEEQAAVDDALDAALRDPAMGPLRELAEAPGFRQAVVNAVEALRLGGIGPDRLEAVAASNPRVTRLLSRTLDRYGGSLAAADRIDTAEVLRRAVVALGTDGRSRPLTFLAPGLGLRGATGELARALLASGATVLRSDPVSVPVPPVVWNAAPDPAPLSGLLDGAWNCVGELELFTASGPAEEIREVLRRIMAAGLRWDEVEIVSTDPVVYGGALHAVAERLDIPVSYAVGLPVERTRAGRAAAAYFRWVQGGYPADVIRRLLESGDLRPADDAPAPGALARRLRGLRIGWGYDRYLPALDRALARLEGPPRPRRKETEQEAAARGARERRSLEALRRLLAPILRATPRLGEVGAHGQVSPAELARGLVVFLEHVHAAPGTPSATARDRLVAVAGRVAATLVRPTEPAAAVALLRRYLEIRVPAPRREGSAPWTSAPAHLHLSDVEHGGLTGRRATFVVGLDADRFPGAGLQDPLLLDRQRRALDPVGLPTSADRLATTRFRMAACLARLRGSVTLSYSAWEPSEAREVAPSAVMLQAFRARTGRADASFEELRAALGEAASAIPAGALLDGGDVWFRTLERDGILRDGTALVRAVHPRLDAGLRAAEARAGETATAHHGLVAPRPELDPRESETVLSASGLEDLGACARRYFYRYLLRLRPPEDPEPDPDVWLDALDRGRLLHAVYEATLREARERGLEGESALGALALEVLDREARRIAREVPPPGQVVRTREMAALRADVRSFVAMAAGAVDQWEALELSFGFGGEAPAELPLGRGTLRLRGAIDRVDRIDGALTVVDYKTGGTGRYERRHGIFHGGRRLQNVIYSAVAESLLGTRVDRMEYHFPTRRGQNEVIGYRRDELRRGLGLVDRLLEGVAAGRFLPTEEPGDCRFCDYAPICRHRAEGWSRETPLADWAAERFGELPVYRERREARVWEETFLAELEEHGEAS